MLVDVGRRRRGGNRARGDRRPVRRRQGIAADERRRHPLHVFAAGDVAGYWQLAHTAFREGEVAAENALGHDAVVNNRGVPGRSTPTRRSASVGLTERRRASSTATRRARRHVPWLAVARAVMQNETVGWVKTIHETHYGELLVSSWSARTSPT